MSCFPFSFQDFYVSVVTYGIIQVSTNVEKNVSRDLCKKRILAGLSTKRGKKKMYLPRDTGSVCKSASTKFKCNFILIDFLCAYLSHSLKVGRSVQLAMETYI